MKKKVSAGIIFLCALYSSPAPSVFFTAVQSWILPLTLILILPFVLAGVSTGAVVLVSVKKRYERPLPDQAAPAGMPERESMILR